MDTATDLQIINQNIVALNENVTLLLIVLIAVTMAIFGSILARCIFKYLRS